MRSTDVTPFRLYLDTRYDVPPWPFNQTWQEVLANFPSDLPGSITDFDQALPEDRDNRMHGFLPMEHGLSRTEMACYRDGDALIVLARMWPGPALPDRLAPPLKDSMTFIWMATPETPAVSLWVQCDGAHEGYVSTGAFRWPFGERIPNTREALATGVTCVTRERADHWVLGVRLELSAIPQLKPDAETIRCTAGRFWGDTSERCCWATPVVWSPRPEDMGTLYLVPRAATGKPTLYRADLDYHSDTGEGTLRLQLQGMSNVPVPITVNFGNHAVSGTGTESYQCAWPLMDGGNWACVHVADAADYLLTCEKWSGQRFFVRVPAAPWPSREMLVDAFAQWHARLEQKYIAPGTWATRTDHVKRTLCLDGAFMATPYALACLYLEEREVYRARVVEACERFLGEQRVNGDFPCYHLWTDPAPFTGGAYTHGSVSECLVLGYKLTGETRYLESARRASDAYRLYSLDFNTNYMAFALWHLSELYEVTGDGVHLERALWYTQHGILRGLTPGGEFPGHNYYTVYGYIILKGLAKLLRVLPKDHEFTPVLRERVIRLTNQFLSRQRVDGSFDGYYRAEYGQTIQVPGLFEVARALPKMAQELEPALSQMLASSLHGPEFLHGLSYALMARHLHEQHVPAPGW